MTEIEDVLLGHLLGMPSLEFPLLLSRHTIRIIEGFLWHGPHVLLVLQRVKEMGKEALSEFGKTKRGRERSKGER